MSTVTRDPETLPVIPRREDSKGYWPIPWQAQPSFFAAVEVQIVSGDGVRTITNLDVEQMLATDRTHRGFMARQEIGDRSFAEWVAWQATRNPILDAELEAAELEAAKVVQPLRRPRKAPAKKAAARKPAEGEASS